MDRSDGKKRMGDVMERRERERVMAGFSHIGDQNEEAFEWRSVW
jgi:hypothetical protein